MRLLVVIIIGVLLLDLFSSSEAWLWGRRRRRRCHQPSTRNGNWFNHWDQAFTFTCPSGQAMTGIRSIYSSCARDRVFKFACKWNKAVGTCHWSHYVNNFDQLVAFKCPYSGFITGISSYHQNAFEDRRFKFRCCNLDHRFHRYQCSSGSHFVNGWRHAFNFQAPWKHFLVGVISYHDNGQEDRRWKFETCKVARNTHGWRSRKRKAKKN